MSLRVRAALVLVISMAAYACAPKPPCGDNVANCPGGSAAPPNQPVPFPPNYQNFCVVTTGSGAATPQTDGEIFAIAFKSGAAPAILIGGSFTHVNGQFTGPLVRMPIGGSLDTSFKPGLTGEVHAIAWDGTGIIVGGRFTTPSPQVRNNLARFTPQGVLDASYGVNNGGVEGATEINEVNSIAIDSLHRVVVGGDFSAVKSDVTHVSPKVARLNPDGTVDTSFSAKSNPPNLAVNSVGVDSQRRVVIGGRFTTLSSAAFRYLARLGQNGVVDKTFGEQNSPPNTNGNPNGEVRAVRIDAMDNVVFGGIFTKVNGAPRLGIARFTSAGGFNNQTFYSGASVQGPQSGLGSVNAIEFDNLNKLVIGGSFALADGTMKGSVARLMANGQIDNAFYPVEPIKTGGKNGVDGRVNALLPCNSVIAGGLFDTVGPNSQHNVVRFTNKGAYQNSF